MGRIAELCSEIVEMAEERGEGLVLSPDAWDRLRDEFTDEEIEDALGLVHDSQLLGDLVESADSLSARLLDLLGSFGDAAAFRRAEEGEARLPLEIIGQLTRRVARLEEILAGYREGSPPDRRGFDALQRRLADVGIESEMTPDELERTRAEAPNGEDEEEEDEDEE
jgi:hypothetical protein